MKKKNCILQFLKRLTYQYTWSNCLYDIKFGIKNIKTYLPIVWKLRPWTFEGSFEFMQTYLQNLNNTLEFNGHEVDEDRLPKIIDIKRCIELLDNIRKDDYMNRCGFIPPDDIWFEETEDSRPDRKLYEMKSNSSTSAKDFIKIYRKSIKLQESEWKELWDTIKNGNKTKYEHGARSWWD